MMSDSTPSINNIEREYGQPFDEILRGFAADNHNRQFTAQALGVSRSWLYYQLDKLKAMEVIFDWPCPYATRYVHNKPRSPAQIAAFNENLITKAREGSIRYWNENRVINADKMDKALELRKEGTTWRKIASILGTDTSVLYRSRRRMKVVDPLGNKLQKQAQKDWVKRHP